MTTVTKRLLLCGSGHALPRTALEHATERWNNMRRIMSIHRSRRTTTTTSSSSCCCSSRSRNRRNGCSIHGDRNMARQYERAAVVCYGRKSSSRALQELLDNKAEKEEEEEEEDTKTFVLKEPVSFTSPLSILKYPDPLLRAQNATIECFDESLKCLSDEMFDIMYEDDGVGLAAPQVGVNVRMMVFNETGDPEKKDAEVVLVNPKIVSTSGPKTVFEEGCLSFPSLYGDVVRPRRVRVKAQDLSGKSFFMNIDAFPARIFQHEYDHLQGVLFCDRMNADVLDGLREDLIAMEEAYVKAHPGVEIRRLPSP